jgi:hypothetical protein
MKTIELGHIYELNNKHQGTQKLVFFKDLPEGDENNHDGVLCQEVIRVLINRYIELYVQKPCEETNLIILKLREVLILGEKRAFANSLEKAYAKSGQNVESLPTQKNGHIFDFKHAFK